MTTLPMVIFGNGAADAPAPATGVDIGAAPEMAAAGAGSDLITVERLMVLSALTTTRA